MKRTVIAGLIAAAIVCMAIASCTKPLASAIVQPDINFASRDFAAVPNDIYYAVRAALQKEGYGVASENLQGGVIESNWVPVTSDSHYMPIFGRRDYGVTNSYHQLEIQIVPMGGRTEVKVGSRAKTLVASLKSSGIEERKILDDIGDALRKSEPPLTNLGTEE